VALFFYGLDSEVMDYGLKLFRVAEIAAVPCGLGPVTTLVRLKEPFAPPLDY
jgi:hypothetical protein